MANKCVAFALMLLLFLPALAHAAGQVCTILPDKGTLVIQVGKMDEFLGLVRNKMTEEAQADVACYVAKGTKVIITDWGILSSTIRVLDGPGKGCVGDIPLEAYGTSCH